MQPLETPPVDFEAGSDLVACFRRSAAKRPNAIALVSSSRKVSFGELAERVDRLASALSALGIARGDRVAMLMKTSIEYVESFFGALAAGACAVPLPALASVEALRLMLVDSASKALFVGSGFEAQAAELAGASERLANDTRIAVGFSAPGWSSYESLFARESRAAPAIEPSANDEFNVIYSSGTTGVPKGIVHTHAMRAAFARGTAVFGVGPRATNVVATPLYSNTTMVTFLPALAFGATNVLMEKFDARELLRLIEAERITHAMLVPVQYDRILRVDDFDRFDIGSLQMKLSTSAPLRLELKRQILERMPGALVEIYGLTEGGVATVLVANAWPDKLESVGQPVPGCEVKIIDDEGGELERGRIGEVVGRSPIMMKGYNNRPDATNEMLWHDASGRVFFRTGDVGRVDEDGFLYLLDRKKDVIISGGLNIYASDLEAVVAKHPAVHEVCVIGAPSTEWGETPVAVVVLEPGATDTPESIREWANAQLGKSQRISRIELATELPKNAIGKVLKRELKARVADPS